MKNILIVGNVPIPAAAKAFGIDSAVGGGWISGFIETLKSEGEYRIAFAFPCAVINDLQIEDFDGVTYYAFPVPKIFGVFPIVNPCKSSRKMRSSIKAILEKQKPAILHVFGTEYVHSVEFIQSYAKPNRTFLHIQGVCSFLGTHFLDGIPWYVRHMIVPSCLITGTLQHQKNIFTSTRAKNEAKAMKMAGHILGRTDWDKACVSIISPSSEYHHIGEILRDPFYIGKWNYNKIEKHSIYLSQVSSTFKGFHIFLQALVLVLRKYPDCKVYIAGSEHISCKGFKSALQRGPYACYIRYLINKYKLWGNLFFLGPQSAEAVKEHLLKTNVFVSSSIIENSPNSLGEAMLLGVPSIASDVGGTSSMMVHNVDGFIYQSNAPYMLAYYICKVFFMSKEELEVMSKSARIHALANHSKTDILMAELLLYRNVVKG